MYTGRCRLYIAWVRSAAEPGICTQTQSREAEGLFLLEGGYNYIQDCGIIQRWAHDSIFSGGKNTLVRVDLR